MAMHGHSEACCNTPPVQVDSYKEKGEYVEVNGMKVYATGPAHAKTAILIVYDIFGFSKQLLQGADVLAHADDEHHQYRVYIPDFLQGQYADLSWFPPDTKDKEEKLGNFFKSPGNPPDTVKHVLPTVKALKEKFSGVEQWALLGYCWGGKVVALTLHSDSEGTIKAAASAHPAMVDAADAKGIKVPFCLLASGDEPADDVAKFEQGLSGPKHVETFKDQVHGWMAARGDLKKEEVKKEYQRGYKTLLDFFHKHV